MSQIPRTKFKIKSMLWFMHGELHLETVHEYKLQISTVHLIYGQIFKLKGP